VTATEVSHCGSGCSLGDVISEFVIFGLGLTIAGVALWAEYVGDYILALALGIVFQYVAIAPMRHLGVKDGLKAATKADFISLTAFEIVLFGWMAIMAFVLFPAPRRLTPSSAAFWFLMQIGMIIGFWTATCGRGGSRRLPLSPPGGARAGSRSQRAWSRRGRRRPVSGRSRSRPRKGRSCPRLRSPRPGPAGRAGRL
jgi:hypothetical protein